MPSAVSRRSEQEPRMASRAAAIPASYVPSWLIKVAMSSVGLISPPLISEKWRRRVSKARLANSSLFLITPTVTMA
jgi:hypothetical protein